MKRDKENTTAVGYITAIRKRSKEQRLVNAWAIVSFRTLDGFLHKLTYSKWPLLSCYAIYHVEFSESYVVRKLEYRGTRDLSQQEATDLLKKYYKKPLVRDFGGYPVSLTTLNNSLGGVPSVHNIAEITEDVIILLNAFPKYANTLNIMVKEFKNRKPITTSIGVRELISRVKSNPVMYCFKTFESNMGVMKAEMLEYLILNRWKLKVSYLDLSAVYVFQKTIVKYVESEGHMAFHKEDLLEGGLTEKVHQRLVEMGQLIPVHNDMYSPLFAHVISNRIANTLQRICTQTFQEFEMRCYIPEDVDEKQREAILNASTEPLLIIDGGAGCGKTSRVLKYIVETRTDIEETRIVAPTGAAAMRINNVLKTNRIQAQTMDMLRCEIIHNMQDSKFITSLIIDEGSMVNERKLASLCFLLQELRQLIIIGDSNQIEPIGYGCPMQDIMKWENASVVHLDKCYRVDPACQVLLRNAQAILDKNPSILDYTENALDDHPFCIIKRRGDSDSDICQDVLQIMQKKGLSNRDVQIICPQRNLCNLINREYDLQNFQIMRKYVPNICFVGRKIVFTKNLYKEHSPFVCNGTVDYIKSIYRGSIKDSKHGICMNDEVHRIGYKEIVEMESGRCFLKSTINSGIIIGGTAITGHRSQGNEWEITIIALSKIVDSERYRNWLNRRLFYTILTRSMKKVIIVCGEGETEKIISDHEPVRRKTILTKSIIQHVRSELYLSTENSVLFSDEEG